MGTPYAVSSDLVSAYPAKSLAIAQYIDAYKLDTGPVQNAQTGTSFTFALTDTTKTVTANNAAASAYTVPPQSSVVWEAYTVLRLLNLGAGVVTLTAGAGVTLTGTLTVAQYQSATLVRTGSNAWTVTGNGPGAKILQVVSATYSTATSTSSTSYVDTGLTATITPSSATSKILAFVSQTFEKGNNATSQVAAQLVRNSTGICVFTFNLMASNPTAINFVAAASTNYLDSPATTSATVYKTQFKATSQTVYAQNGTGDTSTITLMEVSA
mgnify:CR=1 FL=1